MAQIKKEFNLHSYKSLSSSSLSRFYKHGVVTLLLFIKYFFRTFFIPREKKQLNKRDSGSL